MKIIDININEQKKGLYRKSGGGNEWKDLGKKSASQVLSEKEILELSGLIKKIEDHYGIPQDIEWAQEKNGKFYITQSRPITTLKKREDKKEEKIFIKEHSRNYSLLKLFGWSEAANNGIKEILDVGLGESCAIYKGKGLVDVFYCNKDLKKFYKSLTAYGNNNPKFIKKQIDNFYKNFDKLNAYYSRRKKIVNTKELKRIYDIYVKYWIYLSIVFNIPNLKVGEKLKDYAYLAREKTQEYNESIEIIFRNYIESNFSTLKGKSRFVTPEDIWSGDISSVDFIKKIKAREQGYILYKNNIYTGNSDNILNDLGIILQTEKNINDNKIKGEIAQSGKVEGSIKLILSKKDLSKIKSGDVLVAAMTMPSYISVMKRASAFITDEGGITCHAAIISRELKKPCIIGTKIATQVLKDGDLVEVDADKGVVRILERAEIE